MAFLDTLRQNNRMLGTPAGGTYGNEMYYGQPPISGASGDGGNIDILGLMNHVRDRDLLDFKRRTRITGDETIRQENYRRMFDPNSGWMGNQPQNVVYQRPPSEMDQIGPLDKAKLDLERRKIDESGGINRAELGLKGKEYELDKLKNEQIYGTKQADMERKTTDANQRLQLAYDKLQQDAGNAQNIAAYRQAQVDATNARMELMQHQHETDATETKRLHDATIAKMQAEMDALKSGRTSEDVWTDANGIQHKIVDSSKGTRPVKKGNTPGTVRVIAPDGTHGDFPANKPLPKGYTHIGQ